MTFAGMWAELAGIGRDPSTAGYQRGGWTPAEREAYAWFLDACAARGLDVETDALGNTIAWWRPDPRRRDPGVVTGSHLDSVPDGGAFDGPLGVVSALAAVDRLREDGLVPARPVGVAVFVEEEGSRFGLPCLGSRFATGTVDPDRLRRLRDRDGLALPAALERVGLGLDPSGLDPAGLGASDLPARVDVFVELHVEQGRGLADAGAPVGVATAIWPHGRWRLEVTPGATNAVPSAVRAWLDARAADEASLDALVAAVLTEAQDHAGLDGTTLAVTAESFSARVDFDPALRDRLASVVGQAIGRDDGSGDRPAPGTATTPTLPTAAGHDAGVLAAAGVPTAMLFVRNPTGVSHSPQEHADARDCAAGVEALAAVLADLAAGPRDAGSPA